MRKFTKRAISVMTAGMLLFGCVSLSGCGSKEPAVSVPTEEELTAVRTALIDNTETIGLSEIKSMELYENGVRIAGDKMNVVRDNHKYYYTDTVKRVVDYADGYQMDIPTDWVPDYTLSALRARYTNDNVVLTVSKEESVYADTKKFVDECMNRYLIDEKYRKSNKITLLGDITTTQQGKYTREVIKTKIEGMAEDRLAYYTHVTFYSGSPRIYRLVFKSTTEMDFTSILDSFDTSAPQGIGMNNFSYELKVPENWSQETKDYYAKLQSSETVDWGLFSSYIEKTGYTKNIPALEKKMDYTFPVISQYVHYGTGFPLDFAKQVDADGRMLQMSYQYTSNNNGPLNEYLPSLDIYRGTEKAMTTLRFFAKQIKEYGKPLLFRLNNEMNTDWTSYCALANMSDPDIFIETWKTLYKVFEEEGVDNAIWIFNAFDGSFPPGNWSNYLNYLPPSDYVNMIGLTGYNSGEEGGNWRSFETIYDGIKTDYDRYFAKWPWIISEFGCGHNQTEEGEKKQAQWVTDMFSNLAAGKYPNIKVAIWFSANDYFEDGAVKNPFSLDVNNKATMDAFKEGFALTQE